MRTESGSEERGLTDAASVEHDIPGLTITKAPEDGDAAGYGNDGENVPGFWGTFCKDCIVVCGGPQVFVSDRSLPQGQGVGDPMSKKGALSREELGEGGEGERDEPSKKLVTQTTTPARTPITNGNERR